MVTVGYAPVLWCKFDGPRLLAGYARAYGVNIPL